MLESVDQGGGSGRRETRQVPLGRVAPSTGGAQLRSSASVLPKTNSLGTWIATRSSALTAKVSPLSQTKAPMPPPAATERR